jgi:hypothetical protein
MFAIIVQQSLYVRSATRINEYEVWNSNISHLFSIAGALGEGKGRPRTHMRCLIFLQQTCLIPTMMEVTRGDEIRNKKA